MKKLFYFLITVLSTLWSCGGDDKGIDNPDTPDNPTNTTLDISTTDLTFEAIGGQKEFTVYCNSDWTITNNSTWCKTNVTNGNGDKTITVTAETYSETEDQNTNLTIKAGDKTKVLTITQKHGDAIILTKDKFEVLQEGDNITIEVKSNIEYQVAVPSKFQSWIKQAVKSRTVEIKNFSFTISANEDFDKREGYIVFSGNSVKDTVYVYQAQKNQLILTGNTYNISAEKKDITVELKTNVDYEVTIPNDAKSWISQITTRAIRTDKLNFSIAKNAQTNDRKAVIIIKDKNSLLTDTLLIKQMGLIDERSILIKFYNATHGDNWITNTNWCSDKPLKEWIGIDTDQNGKVTLISLSNNHLTGSLPPEISLLSSLRFLIIPNNDIEGNIPKELSQIFRLSQLELNGNRMSGEIPEEIQDYPFFHLWNPEALIYPQQANYGLYINEDPKPADPLDGLVYTYMKSLKKQEVSLILMGDGFVHDDMGRNGKYENYLKEITDYIFTVEPFQSYRDYFTVYFVNAVSEESGVSTMDESKKTVFSTLVGSENSAGMYINQELCYKYAEKTGITGNNGAIVVISNTTLIGGSSGGKWKEGGFASITLSNGYASTALHELGHAFARLYDEYVTAPDQTFPASAAADLTYTHQLGASLNVDATNDLSKIIWKHFIGHPKYPMVGAFEGALWGKGIWRPEQTSCMDDLRPYFNGPSREAIVKRIKSLAGEPYSWDEFVSKDKLD